MSMSSEALARAVVSKEKIPCRAGKHTDKCACKGTKWVTACEGCGGAGFNGKLQKVCGTCHGTGCVMAMAPTEKA